MLDSTLQTVELDQLPASQLQKLNREELRFLLRMDLCRRWERGEKPSAETYLSTWPELAHDSDLLLELVSLEVSLRLGQGELPEIGDITGRFPQIRDELEHHFALHQTLAQSGESQADNSESAPDSMETVDEQLLSRDPSSWDPNVTRPNASLASLPAQSIADYELLDELGRGGMGVVYRARQRKLNRLVALKMILHAGMISTAERERFDREAELIAKLQHPNVVQIFDFGEHEGKPYFSLELVEGGSLDRFLRKNPLAPRDAARLVGTLAGAMQAAHDVGVVHRDLKPGNVLIASPDSEEATVEQWVPKLTDFGLARQVDQATFTQEGAIVGTPCYMAPEQAAGRISEIDATTDVYALGAILYECLTGRPPFKAATSARTILQVLEEDPVAVTRIQPGTPRDLETICLKCLQKDQSKRYRSAGELADDLQRFLDNKPIQARPIRPMERVVRWTKRHPAVASLLIIIFLLLGTGLSLITWQWREAVQQRKRAEIAQRKAQKETTRAKAAEQAEKQAHAETREMEDQLTRSLLATASFAKDLVEGKKRSKNWARVTRVTFEENARVLERRLARQNSAKMQMYLMRSHAFLGVLSLQQGEKQKAMEHLQRSAELVDQLRSVDPSAIGDRVVYGEACYVLGAALRLLGQTEQAIVPMQQAVVIRQAALNDDLKNAALRKATSDAYFELGHLLRLHGRIAEAARSAGKRKKLWPSNPDQIYDAACELARCAAAVGKGKAKLTAEEQKEKDAYGAQAVEVLKEALKKGLTGPEGILTDPDFKPLRPRADFQELARGLKKS